MYYFRFVISFIVIALPVLAMADAEDDATYIVEQTVNEQMFAAALTALGPVIVGAIENDLRQQGITVSDMETFSQIIFEEFVGGFTDEMQTVTVQWYVETFTEEELDGIAGFFPNGPRSGLSALYAGTHGVRLSTGRAYR